MTRTSERQMQAMDLSCRTALVVLISLGATRAAAAQVLPGSPPRFEVTFAADAHRGPVTGRLVLFVAKTDQPEPRLALSLRGPAVFGVDLDQLRPDQPAIVDNSAVGYPARLSELPPGDYYVQAVINVYERVHRSDGHTIWVHMNDGTLEFFNNAAGNLYSDVQRVHIGGTAGRGTIRLAATHVMPRAARPIDTEWLKHVRIQSKKLTRFWGRPVFVNAIVLLPRGYAAHPDVRYPSIYTLGHGVPFGFTTDSSEVREPGKINERTGLETGFDFYKTWRSDTFPRVIAITFEQQTPYFPDSYSVNSANNGPYGDAIMEEVIPYLEQRFRIIGKPYARLVEGASTGGWQALALQLRNPDFFGGAWVLQPDPIDFSRYLLTDIYQDSNAFFVASGQFTSVDHPFQRTTEGQPLFTTRQLSLFEEVLGTHGRSGYQLGAWEAVYGPVGADGYPKPLWDKRSGKIDHEVAAYMRDNGYDLRDYAQRNWPTLGPKIVGKLHFFSGDMDDFHLNLAVYRFQNFLASTTNPHYEAEFTYGRPMKGHSWHAWTWGGMVREMSEFIKSKAPSGEQPSAWTY